MIPKVGKTNRSRQRGQVLESSALVFLANGFKVKLTTVRTPLDLPHLLSCAFPLIRLRFYFDALGTLSSSAVAG